MEPRVGLCGSCEHVKVVESGRGSSFYLCTESQRDPTLRKYPSLPVVRCHGYRVMQVPRSP